MGMMWVLVVLVGLVLNTVCILVFEDMLKDFLGGKPKLLKWVRRISVIPPMAYVIAFSLVIIFITLLVTSTIKEMWE